MGNDPTAKLREVLAPGRLFEDKYRIIGSLGSGSFAHVLKARHEVMDRDVALKVLKPELVQAQPEVVERFLNEVRIVSKLRHPNTVTVFDFGRAHGHISYQVMEYVEGVSLEDVLKAEGPLEPRRVVRIAKQILKSLDEAHAAGIVHRDLKPSNIMLTELHGESDFVKVLDFGVAKLVDAQADARDQFQRRSTQFIGTPIYMSPEQVLGESVVPASDLYSLGLIIYEMLTGEDPVDAETVAGVAQIHIDDEPIPFPSLDRLTARFQKLILKATARGVTDRFTNVRDFARQLPTSGADHSAEFSGLMLDEIATDKSRDEGLEEISENTWDAFSGKNYIAPPESDAEDVGPRPTRKRQREPQKKPKRRGRAKVEEDSIRPRPRESLSVDVGKLRRDELRKGREEGRRGPAVVSSGADSPLWLASGSVGFYVAFVIASTVFVSGGGAGRWFIGLLPLGAAVLWTQFSGVRRLHGSFVERWLIPIGRHMTYTVLALCLFVAVVMPERAASRMSNDAAWFVSALGDEGSMSFLVRVVELTGELLAGLFSFASRVVPW